MKRINKKLVIVIIALMIISAVYGVAYADSIGNTISSIVNRVTVFFDSIGNNTTTASQQEMTNIATQTKNTINNIQDKSQQELTNDLSEYKNSQLQKKNQEINAFIIDTQNTINKKKAEKLDEYKQKIDEKIDKEYDKLINDLTLGN